MKRALALFLVALFLVSVAGCTPKSEYDKLLVEKASVQKKCDELSSVKVNLEGQLTAKQKEIRKLSDELKQAEAKLNEVTKELKKAKAMQ